jgi:hypothetical protein
MSWWGIAAGAGLIGTGIAAIWTGILAPAGVPLIGTGVSLIGGTAVYDWVTATPEAGEASGIVGTIGSFGWVIIAIAAIFLLKK